MYWLMLEEGRKYISGMDRGMESIRRELATLKTVTALLARYAPEETGAEETAKQLCGRIEQSLEEDIACAADGMRGIFGCLPRDNEGTPEALEWMRRRGLVYTVKREESPEAEKSSETENPS